MSLFDDKLAPCTPTNAIGMRFAFLLVFNLLLTPGLPRVSLGERRLSRLCDHLRRCKQLIFQRVKVDLWADTLARM